jgi:hypothetical protein
VRSEAADRYFVQGKILVAREERERLTACVFRSHRRSRSDCDVLRVLQSSATAHWHGRRAPDAVDAGVVRGEVPTTRHVRNSGVLTVSTAA